MCIGWSFASEPEPSEARVCVAIHVLLLKRYIHLDCIVVPWFIGEDTGTYFQICLRTCVWKHLHIYIVDGVF